MRGGGDGGWGEGRLIPHTRPVLKRITQCVKTGKKTVQAGAKSQ